MLRRCAAAARACPTARSRSAAALSTTSRAWRRTPYLLGIAGIIIAGQTIGAFMYNEQGKYVAAHYASLADRAALFASMEIAVNLLSLFFQAVVVTWLTRRGSVALSLSAMPLLLGASFMVLALFPAGRRAAGHAGDRGAPPTTVSASRRAKCCSPC